MNESVVINLIGLLGVDNAKIERVLGRMPPTIMDKVSDCAARMLGL
jgi:hypothetical protein